MLVPVVIDERTIVDRDIQVSREYVMLYWRTYQRVTYRVFPKVDWFDPNPPNPPVFPEDDKYLYKPLTMACQDAIDLVVNRPKPEPMNFDSYPFPKGFNNVTKLDNTPVIVFTPCRKSVMRGKLTSKNVYSRKDGTHYVRFGNVHVTATRESEHHPFKVIAP